jgi:uncharacterized protein (TIGR00369 family)
MKSTPEILTIVRDMMTSRIPFNGFLGMTVDHVDAGLARLCIPFRPEFIGDAARPALHGGLISTLIDTAGGAAVWTTVGRHDRVSTIDLRIDYLRPGRAEDLVAEARVVRVGNRVGVVTVRAFHPSAPEETVADGKGVYNIKRGPKEGDAGTTAT